jgi:hypothetical protein
LIDIAGIVPSRRSTETTASIPWVRFSVAGWWRQRAARNEPRRTVGAVGPRGSDRRLGVDGGEAAAVGAEFATYPSVPLWPAGVALEEQWQERCMPALFGLGTRDDIVRAANDFVPDVLVVDCMVGAGFDAARMLGLPTVLLVHLLYSRFVDAWGDAAEQAVRARVLDATDVALALVPPGFDAPTKAREARYRRARSRRRARRR